MGGNTLATGLNNSNTTFSGVISGVGGSLQKQGAGTFTLYGANTYSGGTSVAAGALTFGNRAWVGDTTAVSVAAGATVGFGVGSNTTTYSGATDLNNAFGGTFPGTAPPTSPRIRRPVSASIRPRAASATLPPSQPPRWG